MGTIKRFEEITAWQEGRKLAKLVYDLTRAGALSKDFGMRDQIQRAAVSVSFDAVYECPRHCSYLIYRLLETLKKSTVQGERCEKFETFEKCETSLTMV